ncbi:MAG: hypothetical protein M5U19_23385 [Microthrixaceae bacterium]|nr:hypothetical protein [Microthrixaceae bacterium]
MVIGDFAFGVHDRRRHPHRCPPAHPTREAWLVRVVVKVGTSSLTDAAGRIDDAAVGHVASEVASLALPAPELRRTRCCWCPPVRSPQAFPRSVGMPAAGPVTRGRSRRSPLWVRCTCWMPGAGRSPATIWCPARLLLAPLDFGHRAQYLQARSTLERLIELGVVPVINENDAIADDEIRFGDNDRIAALVAQLVAADLLVLLTDTPGLMDADPRLTVEAELVEEIAEIDRELERVTPGAGTARGSGGMASKLAAAKMASWSGVRCLIAHARRSDVLLGAVAGEREWAPGSPPMSGAWALASCGSRSPCRPRAGW